MSRELCAKLTYQFNDEHLLTMALTHRSKGGENNERLEFLGDAIVNFIVGEALYLQHPTAAEGELSRWRATLINRDTLAELAKHFDLGQYLILGPGEMRSGGSGRQSILSCAMESLIGAIYLDAGFDVIREKIMEWYEPWLSTLKPAASHKDPKTLLQEYLQGKRLALPVYHVESISGEAHQQRFTVRCSVDQKKISSTGTGTSRRRAEQEAATAMLALLKEKK